MAIEPIAGAQDWWTGFDDPALAGLVEQALARNARLQVARANVETGRAVLRAQQLDLSPSTASAVSGDLGQAPRSGAEPELSAAGSLGARWEWDLFGRIDALVAGAQASLTVLEEARRDVAVIVAADTARAYADLRGGQVRLSVARRNVELQAESLELLRTLFDNGRATQLDLDRAEAQYRTTLATLPSLEADIRTAGVQLASLAGVTDGFVIDPVADAPGAAQIPQLQGGLLSGAPDGLIRRRPDVRAAEAEIVRRLALGKAERARLFPRLTLNGNLLTALNDNNDLGESFGFGIGPALSWEGPDLRRVYGDIAVADAQARAAMAGYEAVVTAALEEVDLALIGFVRERSRRADLAAAAAAAERAVGLARLRFEEGLDDFLDVIDAQRTLLDAQDRLESSRLEETRRAIEAYRALGGIFDNATLEAIAGADRTGHAP